MAMLLLEVVLTRVYSVTMYYHFAFMIVSISLFGLAVSGTVIYLNPTRFPRARAGDHMSRAATLFTVAVPVCYLLQRWLPSSPDSPNYGFVYLFLTYVIMAVPFFLGGTAISLGLTHYSSRVAQLYFADLVGASIGCALVFPALSFLTGPDVVALVAVLGGIAALSFSKMATRRGARVRAWWAFGLVAAVLVMNATSIYRLLNAGSRAVVNPITHEELKPIAVDWNPMSRVIAYNGSIRPAYRPGSSPDSVFYPEQILLQIDRSAITAAIPFDGDFNKVDWIYTDVSALPLLLKPGSKVLDIGSGGGQYALTALATGSKDVSCVEINPTIVDWTKTRFDKLTGSIYNRPEVHVFVGDGRTFAAASKEKYDIISFVSSTTFTATASGAFMFVENNLYTVESFHSYFEHLNPDGVINVSQVMTRDYPGLLLRIASLGRRTLEDQGIHDAANHILVVMQKSEGYGSVLISRSPLTQLELDRTDSLAARMSWVVLHSPRVNNHREFHDVLTTPNLATFLTTLPLNLFPPTDDRPFFFNLVPFKNLGSAATGRYDLKYGQTPARILVNLFYIVLGLTVLFLIVPLILNRRARLAHKPGTGAALAFFMMIGLAFIMVEVPLMQRFVLFLGHPAYSIAVVLFSILLFSGCGSMLTKKLDSHSSRKWLKLSLPGLIALLIVYNFTLNFLFSGAQHEPQLVRILISIVLLLPLGLLMGMPFPVMMKWTSDFSPAMVSWCWGVNGATSVLGSVSAVIVALSSGFSASLMLGALAYLAAFGCVWILPSAIAASEEVPAVNGARVGIPA